jgi:Homeodomain-like domain
MRSAEEFDAAKRLMAAGLNDCAIARRIGVPRTTVRDWRRRPAIRARHLDGPCGKAHVFAQLSAGAYCYLLGLYLGDGCISRSGRVWHLRVTLDKKYPAIIDRCRHAIEVLMPGQHTGIVQRVGCVDVSLFSKRWPCLLPQHGPGKKHTRRIALEPWQPSSIRPTRSSSSVWFTATAVASSRTTAASWASAILFTAALDALDIPWTRSTKYIVSIYRKAATARLDEFVGPKDRAVPLNGVHYAA